MSENKNIWIVVGVIIICLGAWYLFGSGSGGEADLQQRADRVEGNIESTKQHNDTAATELLRAQETIKRLEAANSALAETNSRLSESNNRLNELVEQGIAGEQGNKELANRIKQIVQRVSERNPISN